MDIKRIILLRTQVVVFGGIILGISIAVRLFFVQHSAPNDGTAQRQLLTQRHIPLPANRGNVYADDGSLLATSLPFYRLAMDPTLPNETLLLAHVDSLGWRLARFFGGDYKKYVRRIMQARKKGKQYIVLAKKRITHIQKQKIMQWPLVRLGRLMGGVFFEKSSHRFLPYDALAQRTIGYLGNKNQGLVGLEYSFDKVLSGQDGQVLVSRSRGRWHPVYDGTELYPRHGLDIETTLSINMQDIVQGALLEGLTAHQAKYGSVILMEVATGEIKAIANLTRGPTGRYGVEYNYAVGSQGAVEPGSTFKLASLLAMLERSNLALTDTVQTGNGAFQFYDHIMRDSRPGGGGFGLLQARDAFEQSSNIGVARLLMRHFGNRPADFLNYLHDLHLDQPLGFQLKGTGKPYIKTLADTTWSGTTLAWMSHGYELLMSPLQVLTLYNAVANDGRMVSPLLVRRILNKKRTIERFESRVIHPQIASAANIAIIQSLLKGVVNNGTAKTIASPYYEIAGKTGTAKKYIDGRYIDAYYCSFAGYFPAEKPLYSCIVIVDTPRAGRIYGGTVAAPIFKKIADQICFKLIRFAYTAVANGMPRIGGGFGSDLQYLCQAMGVPHRAFPTDEWVKTRALNQQVVPATLAIQRKRMPDVRGLVLRDALYLLENKSLRVQRAGTGTRVAQQRPPPGRSVSQGTTVQLTLQ